MLLYITIFSQRVGQSAPLNSSCFIMNEGSDGYNDVMTSKLCVYRKGNTTRGGFLDAREIY